MAKKISAQEIAAIYDCSIRVVGGEMSKQDARELVNRLYGTSLGSVGLMIGSVECLLDGSTYKRSLSEGAVRHFLTRILQDKGPAGLRIALSSLEAHIHYYERIRNTVRKGLRDIHDEFLQEVGAVEALPTLAEMNVRLEEQVNDIKSLGDEELLERAKLALQGPAEAVLAKSKAFRRNPYVKAYVLRRAGGNCENARCHNPVPFRREDGSVFLEVHHRIPLAEGGEDTVENAAALCPNCHREAHFGENWKQFRT